MALEQYQVVATDSRHQTRFWTEHNYTWQRLNSLHVQHLVMQIISNASMQISEFMNAARTRARAEILKLNPSHKCRSNLSRNCLPNHSKNSNGRLPKPIHKYFLSSDSHMNTRTNLHNKLLPKQQLYRNGRLKFKLEQSQKLIYNASAVDQMFPRDQTLILQQGPQNFRTQKNHKGNKSI